MALYGGLTILVSVLWWSVLYHLRATEPRHWLYTFAGGFLGGTLLVVVGWPILIAYVVWCVVRHRPLIPSS